MVTLGDFLLYESNISQLSIQARGKFIRVGIFVFVMVVVDISEALTFTGASPFNFREQWNHSMIFF